MGWTRSQAGYGEHRPVPRRSRATALRAITVALPLVARANTREGALRHGSGHRAGRGGGVPGGARAGSQLRLILQTPTGPLDRVGTVVWTKRRGCISTASRSEPEPRTFAVYLPPGAWG
jgi:hypothetical protein